MIKHQSLQAVASRIYTEIEAGWVYDNSRLNYELVRAKVIIARASLLGRLLSQYIGRIPGMYFQECCIDVNCIDVCNSGTLTLEACIPDLIGSLGKRGIRYVGSPDYKHSFSYKEDTMQPQLRPYTTYGDDSKEASYTILGNKLRLMNPTTPNLKKIVVRMIPANPMDCAPCDECKVFVPADHLTEIEKLVKLELSGFLVQRKIDKMNDANPNN